MNRKVNQEKFIANVLKLEELLEEYSLREILAAAARVYKKVKLYEFMEMADEAHEDARRIES